MILNIYLISFTFQFLFSENYEKSLKIIINWCANFVSGRFSVKEELLSTSMKVASIFLQNSYFSYCTFPNITLLEQFNKEARKY